MVSVYRTKVFTVVVEASACVLPFLNKIMISNNLKFLNNERRIYITIKSPEVIRSTLVSKALKVNLKHRPISFLDTLLTAQISMKINR